MQMETIQNFRKVSQRERTAKKELNSSASKAQKKRIINNRRELLYSEISFRRLRYTRPCQSIQTCCCTSLTVVSVLCHYKCRRRGFQIFRSPKQLRVYKKLHVLTQNRVELDEEFREWFQISQHGINYSHNRPNFCTKDITQISRTI